MDAFNNSKPGLMDVIRCDEPSYLIWKWRPEGSGNTNRENAIRWGSSLRVKDGELAVFVYDRKAEGKQDFIEGPYDGIIKTDNLPALAGIIGLAYDGASPFQAEVYFINLAQIIQVKFAVPYFDVYDPRFMDFGVPVAVRGTISFQIGDYKNFIKLHRLNSFNQEDFQKQIRDAVTRYVKDVVANAPAAANIPVIQLETRTAQINDVIEHDVAERLQENFGVEVSGIDIGAIDIDKTSDGYSQLMQVTKDVAAATIEAETAAKIKDIRDKQRIEIENYEELLRIQRTEGQYAQHKQTQSSNLTAFQVEKQAEVGVAGANALGQMGSNGASDVNISDGGTGFNPASMMVGMALGGAVGQNLADVMNNMFSGTNSDTQNGTFPPPVPTVEFYMAVNGQAMGPYDLQQLSQMASCGQLTTSSYVWKPGMAEWIKAGMVDELKNLFSEMPPIPPTE